MYQSKKFEESRYDWFNERSKTAKKKRDEPGKILGDQHKNERDAN